jgi:hypothetical protein
MVKVKINIINLKVVTLITYEVFVCKVINIMHLYNKNK